MMQSAKKMTILVTMILLASVFAVAMPASAAVLPPAPSLPPPANPWQHPTGFDVTDIALGPLDDNRGVDVAAIDGYLQETIYAISGRGPGTWNWTNHSCGGFAIGVGDINKNLPGNEVIAGGFNLSTGWGLTAYDKDGNFLWFYSTGFNDVTDIEIGDIDGDGTDDVVACDFGGVGTVYAVNGTGNDLPGWPAYYPAVDVAVGQLDGEDGMDVAAIAKWGAMINNSTGGVIWFNDTYAGQTVEIGDVNGDGKNDVVFGLHKGLILIVTNFTPPPEVVTIKVGSYLDAITDIELGDLDGDLGQEIAAITEADSDKTLHAIDVDLTWNNTTLWTFPISWKTDYFGESLAIGDIDRDYKNEVVAAGCGPHCIYAFDALDSNGDGFGDPVWEPYCVGVDSQITDVEVGDIDGDGDDDVVFGDAGGIKTIYALSKVENKGVPATGTGEVCFDADPSTLRDLTAVPEGTLPPEGKPKNLVFPYGFFSFNITGLTLGQNVTVTITYPVNVPIGSEYWKYGPNGSLPPRDPNPHWYKILIGSDDGDKVITLTLQDGGAGDDDGAANGIIIDQGGIGNPAAPVPILTPLGIAALIGLLSILVTTVLTKRKKR